MKLFGFNEWCRVNESAINEDFKTQRQKFIDEGNSPEEVDRYLFDFRDFKDKRYSELLNSETKDILKINRDIVTKEDIDGFPIEINRINIDAYKTFNDLVAIVDWVSGLRPVGSANYFKDIEIKGGEEVYEDDNLIIYYAPTEEACIEYGGKKNPYTYTWCISRKGSSLFTKYRTGENEPSFYFVKRKNATKKEFDYWNGSTEKFNGTFKDDWHFFVIQAHKLGEYYTVSNSNNDGDVKMSWNQILLVSPELTGLRNYFKHFPLTRDEIKNTSTVSDKHFAKMPYSKKEMYIDRYIDHDDGILRDRILTDTQFIKLPNDLKNKYINTGIRLTNKQLKSILINKSLVKRYTELMARKIKSGDRYSSNFWTYIDPIEWKMLLESSNINEIDNIFKPQITKFISELNSKNIGELLYELIEIIPAFEYIERYCLDLIINKFKEDQGLIAKIGTAISMRNNEEFNQFLTSINISKNKFISYLGEKELKYFGKPWIGPKADLYPKTIWGFPEIYYTANKFPYETEFQRVWIKFIGSPNGSGDFFSEAYFESKNLEYDEFTYTKKSDIYRDWGNIIDAAKRVGYYGDKSNMIDRLDYSGEYPVKIRVIK